MQSISTTKTNAEKKDKQKTFGSGLKICKEHCKNSQKKLKKHRDTNRNRQMIRQQNKAIKEMNKNTYRQTER